jgi:hypothetical protein
LGVCPPVSLMYRGENAPINPQNPAPLNVQKDTSVRMLGAFRHEDLEDGPSRLLHCAPGTHAIQYSRRTTEQTLSKSIFISHAVKDKTLVKEIVELIEEGIGVPETEIFCSSLQGYGIPAGQNFVTFIKDQLIKPKIVVLVLTPAYFESKFCLSELGAAWIMSHRIFPVLVPPLTYADVKDVLLGTQVIKVDDDIGYNELRESCTGQIEFTPKTLTRWDVKRRAFLSAIKPTLEKIEGPTVVSADELEAKEAQLAEMQIELDSYEQQLRDLRERLAATEALKDKAEVTQIAAQYENASPSDRFDALTTAVIAARRKVKVATEVFKFVLCRRYSKPYQIDWYYNRSEFDDAARYGFITLEPEDVVWTKSQMERLSNHLDAVERFVSEHHDALAETEGEDVPMNPEDQDFWEHHYKL